MNVLPLASVKLDVLSRIRGWHLRHRRERPREFQAFNAVLTVWQMGCVGWLPAIVLSAWWALPLCVGAALAPRLYLNWRRRAHVGGHLRCDWIHLAD